MTTLRQTAKFLSGGTPSKSNASYWTGSVPWVSGKDMKQFLLEDTEDHISEEAASDGSKIAPPGSTLLLVRGMSLHDEIRACFIERPMAFNQDVKAIVPLPGVEPAFLAYSVEGRKEELLELVDSASHGTGRILTPALEQLEMYLPEIREQRKISECLHSIDRRIVLNEKLNAALEATAAAVFKSWFVDFDPVVAKSEGRKPFGMTDEIAALFPDRFAPNGLPEGWKLCSLTEIIDVNPTRRIPTPEAVYLEMANLPTVGHGALDWAVRKVGSGLRFTNGDTLLARITPCLENGKTCYVDFLDEGETAWGSTEYIVLRPKSPVPLSVGYLLARLPDFRSFAISQMTGSSGRQRVPTDSLSRYEFPVTDGNVWAAFSELATPLFERMSLNNRQNRALRNLRDAILPGLVSGELQIKEVQREIAGAVG